VTSPEQRAAGTWTHVTLTQSLYTACAVASDGSAWCWGGNGAGELGTGDTDNHPDPVEVAGGHLWSDVQAGNDATCGLARDATVWCWGVSYFGIFGDGDGSQHERDIPGIVPLH
jgi:alpha-tubulin suppressor-like RCC1 family protein